MIFEAADLGVEYWMAAKNRKLEKATLDKTSLIEAKLDGFQRKINLFSGLVRARVRTQASDSLSFSIADFFDALTGGNFGAEARAKDQARARLVYATAADLVALLRATSPRPSWVPIAASAGLLLTILAVVFLPDRNSSSSPKTKPTISCNTTCADKNQKTFDPKSSD